MLKSQEDLYNVDRYAVGMHTEQRIQKTMTC